MRTGTFKKWLTYKWRQEKIEDQQLWQKQRAEQYRMAFASASGQFVLSELLDAYYCTALDSTATVEQLAGHNAQRALVQKILETIDEAEHPGKYKGGE